MIDTLTVYTDDCVFEEKDAIPLETPLSPPRSQTTQPIIIESDRLLLRIIYNRSTHSMRPKRNLSQRVDHHSMPVTPFHFGPALLLGYLLRRRLDLGTFLIANISTDMRAVLVFFGVFPEPLYGSIDWWNIDSYGAVLGTGECIQDDNEAKDGERENDKAHV